MTENILFRTINLMYFYRSEKEARLSATTSHIGKFLADFRHLASVSEAEKAAELSDVTQLKQNLGSSSDNDIICFITIERCMSSIC
jgi:hypothetical protein